MIEVDEDIRLGNIYQQVVVVVAVLGCDFCCSLVILAHVQLLTLMIAAILPPQSLLSKPCVTRYLSRVFFSK